MLNVMAHRPLLACVAFLAILFPGCQAKPPPPDAFGGIVIHGTREHLYRHFDSDVVLVGCAGESDAEGAYVSLADDTRVRVPELRQWPAKVNGKPVTVGGVLRRWPHQAPPHDMFTLQGVRWTRGDAILKRDER